MGEPGVTSRGKRESVMFWVGMEEPPLIFVGMGDETSAVKGKVEFGVDVWKTFPFTVTRGSNAAGLLKVSSRGKVKVVSNGMSNTPSGSDNASREKE